MIAHFFTGSFGFLLLLQAGQIVQAVVAVLVQDEAVHLVAHGIAVGGMAHKQLGAVFVDDLVQVLVDFLALLNVALSAAGHDQLIGFLIGEEAAVAGLAPLRGVIAGHIGVVGVAGGGDPGGEGHIMLALVHGVDIGNMSYLLTSDVCVQRSFLKGAFYQHLAIEHHASASGDYAVDVQILIQQNQIRIASGLYGALARIQRQRFGHVAGDKRQGRFQRDALLRHHAANRTVQVGHLSDAHADDVLAFGVPLGHTAVGVGTHGDPLHHSFLQNLVHHGRRVILGGNVGIAAHAGKRNGLIQNLAQMGGSEMIGRNVCGADNFHDRLDALGRRAGVDMQHAGLTGQQPRHPDVGYQPDDLLPGGVRAAVIGNRQLAAQHLLDVHNVPHDRTGQSRRRILVGAGQTEGGDSFVVQRLGLGHQTLHTAGHAVRPQHAHQGGHTGLHRVGQKQLRCSGMKAALSAAAGDMNMLIQEARRQQLGLVWKSISG